MLFPLSDLLPKLGDTKYIMFISSWPRGPWDAVLSTSWIIKNAVMD